MTALLSASVWVTKLERVEENISARPVVACDPTSPASKFRVKSSFIA